jgi:hypothetical protein
MAEQTSLEITINVTMEHGATGWSEVRIVDWQFNIQPPERFRELPPLHRAALWRKLRDEIDEFWLSTALESDSNAAWNYLLEDVDVDLE